MSSRLQQWAERVLDAQRKGESGHATQIRVFSEGTVWETWLLEGLSVDRFIEESELVKESIAEQCPIKRVPITWVSEDATGAQRSSHPDAVQGKNKQADALAGSGNNAAKAFADAMEGISKVVVATLKSAEVQVQSLTKTLESQAEQIHQMHEYNRVKRELELTVDREDSETSKMIKEQFAQVLPMVPTFFEIWAKERQASLATQAVAKAAAPAVAATINGVPKTS